MIQLRHFDERIYDPDLGKGVSSTQVVAKYLDKKNPEDYYISFTAIDKIGINPKSKYETPIGIYSYPLVEYMEHWAPPKERNPIGSRAPFAGDNPYVNILKVDHSEGKFIEDISTTYGEDDLERDKEKLFEIYDLRDLNAAIGRVNYGASKRFSKYVKDQGYERVGDVDRGELENLTKSFLLEEIGSWEDTAKFPEYPGGRMWNITRMLSKGFKGKPSVQWTMMLRNLGYIGVADRSGIGIIHEGEPFQAVFFSRSAFELIDRIENIGAAQSYSKEEYDKVKEHVHYQVESFLIKGKMHIEKYIIYIKHVLDIRPYVLARLLLKAYDEVVMDSDIQELLASYDDIEDVQKLAREFMKEARKIPKASSKDFQEKFSAGWNSTVDEIAALKGVFVPDDLDVRF